MLHGLIVIFDFFVEQEQDIDDSLVKEIFQHVETCQQKSKVSFGRKDEFKL